MPRVPDIPTPQLALRPLGSDYRDPIPEAAFGGDVARAGLRLGERLGEVAGAVTRRAEARTRETARALADEQAAKFQATAGELLYGDGRGDILSGGFYSLKPKAALDATQPVLDGLQAAYESAVGEARDPVQRRQVEAALRPALIEARHQVVDYADTARRDWLQGSAETRLAVTEADAVRARDPGAKAASAGASKELLQRIATEQGWSEEQYILRLWAQGDRIHGGTVRSLLGIDADRAADYFETYRLNMSGPERETLAGLVRQATVAKGSEQAADGWFHASSASLADPGKLLDALGAPAGGADDFRAAARRLSLTDVAGLKDHALAAKMAADPALTRRLKAESYFYQLDRHGGDHVLALAAYGAGEEVAQRLIRETGDPRTDALTHERFMARIADPTLRTEIGRVLSSAGGLEADPVPAARGVGAGLAQIDTLYADDPKRREAHRHALLNRQAQVDKAAFEREDAAWEALSGRIQTYGSAMSRLVADPDYQALSSTRRVEAEVTIAANGEAAQRQTGDRRLVERHVSREEPLDPANPDDMAALDRDYAVQAGRWAKRPVVDRFRRGIDYAERVGVMPAALVETLEQATGSGDPEAAVAGAAAIAALADDGSALIGQMTPATVQRAWRISRDVEAGVEPAAAVKLAGTRPSAVNEVGLALPAGATDEQPPPVKAVDQFDRDAASGTAAADGAVAGDLTEADRAALMRAARAKPSVLLARVVSSAPKGANPEAKFADGEITEAPSKIMGSINGRRYYGITPEIVKALSNGQLRHTGKLADEIVISTSVDHGWKASWYNDAKGDVYYVFEDKVTGEKSEPMLAYFGRHYFWPAMGMSVRFPEEDGTELDQLLDGIASGVLNRVSETNDAVVDAVQHPLAAAKNLYLSAAAASEAKRRFDANPIGEAAGYVRQLQEAAQAQYRSYRLAKAEGRLPRWFGDKLGSTAYDFAPVDRAAAGLNGLGRLRKLTSEAELVRPRRAKHEGRGPDSPQSKDPAPPADNEEPDSPSDCRPSGKFYTALFYVQLDKAVWGRSHKVHVNRANEQLHIRLLNEPDFADLMEQLIPGITERVSSKGGRQTPIGMTWHHAEKPGELQLVPVGQHDRKSVFWKALHPNGHGGFASWARPAGSPRRGGKGGAKK